MDIKQFDALTRRLSSRRALGGALFGSVTGLLGFGAAQAAPCPPNKKRCRGACIPKPSCCTNANCSPRRTGRVCRAGRCRCRPGRQLCRGVCIPNASCCSNTECQSTPNQVCQDRRCCTVSGGSCLNASTCCTGHMCSTANTCCVPQSPAITCTDRCGDWLDNCGQATTCTCAAGRDCLSNKSCARNCAGGGQCGSGNGCWCSGLIDGGQYCLSGQPKCNEIPEVCGSTADCPVGHACIRTGCGAGGTISNRCFPLCQG